MGVYDRASGLRMGAKKAKILLRFHSLKISIQDLFFKQKKFEKCTTLCNVEAVNCEGKFKD